MFLFCGAAGSQWNELVYAALRSSSIFNLVWFVSFNFAVTMFLMNFVIAHVLNTFELVTAHIVDVGDAERSFRIEQPLPAVAPPDAPVRHFTVTLYQRPSLMKMWQAELDAAAVRDALMAAADEAAVPLPAAALAALHLSFQAFVASRAAALHEHNLRVRLASVSFGPQGARAASLGGGGGSRAQQERSDSGDLLVRQVLLPGSTAAYAQDSDSGSESAQLTSVLAKQQSFGV
jgi:hypothetical protein